MTESLKKLKSATPGRCFRNGEGAQAEGKKAGSVRVEKLNT